MVETPNPTVKYERTDFRLKVVAGVGAATVVLIAVSLIVTGIVLYFFNQRERERNASLLPLAAEERAHMADLLAEERFRERFHGQPPLEGLPDRSKNDAAESDRERLQHFGWVDREKGIVHVPLDRATRAVLENPNKYLRSRPTGKGDKP